MIDSSNKELPSMLRGPKTKYDSMMERIKTVKGYSEKLGSIPPAEYRNDEHYWYIVMTRYGVVSDHLRDTIKDKDQLRIASLSLSINEAEEYMRLEKEKATDGLTNAWSRTALDNFLENLRTKPRNEIKTGLLLLDIDYFKEYNDTNGHPEGDKILKKLVEVMKKHTRSIDMVGRYGGEEFLLITPNLPSETSSGIIEDKAQILRNEIENNLGITVSIGTSTIKDSDRNITDIYKRVDANLYKAKNSGRNIVCSDTGLLPKK